MDAKNILAIGARWKITKKFIQLKEIFTATYAMYNTNLYSASYEKETHKLPVIMINERNNGEKTSFAQLKDMHRVTYLFYTLA